MQYAQCCAPCSLSNVIEERVYVYRQWTKCWNRVHVARNRQTVRCQHVRGSKCSNCLRNRYRLPVGKTVCVDLSNCIFLSSKLSAEAGVVSQSANAILKCYCRAMAVEMNVIECESAGTLFENEHAYVNVVTRLLNRKFAWCTTFVFAVGRGI